MESLANQALRRSRNMDLPTLGRDALAGVISAIVQIAYCISFSALIFQGAIAAGFSLGLAALIMGTVVTGLIVALTSTLSPADAGPDTPAVAVMSVLAGSIAAALAAKGATTQAIILNVMVAISVSTLFTGFLLFGLGALRLGQWVRFIPYPVIAGFLGASGWLLMTGGVEVVTQSNLTLSPASWAILYSSVYGPQIFVGLVFAVAIVFLRRLVPAYLALPVAFVGFLVILNIVLFGFIHDEAVRNAWFLPSIGKLTLWWPISAVMQHEVDWGVLAASSAEIGAVCGITAISMLLDVSSLEVARQKSADLDREFRTNGFANIIAAVLGGAGGNLSLNGAILLEESGAAGRLAGVFVALVCGVVLFSGADIGSMVPKAILMGMLAYLGVTILAETLHSPAQSSWADWILAGAIMLVIVNFGYLMGVVLGVIGACLMFALSYSRIGVVRRHLTRGEFSSNVERAPEQTRLLREEGERLHVFWLSGFIFFGSSNGLFERIRRAIDAQDEKPVGYVVLDFGAVPGLDTSAVLSLIKLRNYCNEHGVTLAFSGLTEAMRSSFQKAGFFAGGQPHQVFATRNEAVEWCEDMLLMYHEVGEASAHSFEGWLTKEFGGAADMSRIAPYLERHELKVGEALFRQGEPPDSVELLASGCVAITIEDQQGRPIRLRRMMGYTIVGEMGFYRQVPRTATVIAEEPSVVYRLTREAFDRMQAQDPTAASVFHKLIIRLLSDRLEFANREISALL
ncbi:MAG TPA: SulP family inorganic anion transporter [Methyloceanibacter sp.]|nr:SulP family inorganic anion transporter [Methyloceanibacter sp.]